ncbi:ShlB/FhaC/HecB family hemolysin secretion/activation protein [Gloeocapsopsis crepidinum LEGE 06123]|uniref:ShlB/FhaC/HecB family hemolysin secretion/activation protein n=1 Tax=Gloeocapsopsis crepidinum LEGE 06123 TaxID=588587 RepID=A0ABR9UY39_9CHRO|nr:ShlB/FhaC/HecB family hemolysin secretion/activation protein [Gloeocapsopsis crepidinum]MBE9192905.1 ShlB/FhaC/HecB family hemolysin secretion/activation protein [Gloeocapsopsis crepidinum LEGE 06123]
MNINILSTLQTEKGIAIALSIIPIFISKSVLAQSPPPGFTLPPDTPETIERTIPQPPQPPQTPPELPSPAPRLEVPPTPSPETPPPIGDRFLVKQVEVLGSTVLQDEIAELTEAFTNREVTFEDLIQLRTDITQLYIDNGYVTSGAFLPVNQDITNGIVTIQVVEGELERIDISGLQRLRSEYVRSRLEIATKPPVNQQRLERALQLLQIDPLIRQVNAELTAGSTAGRNVLQVSLQEAPPFTAGLTTDNRQSPSIGSFQGSVFATHNNLLGFGDRLSAEYGITEGLDIYDINYAIPVNASNGTLGLRYGNSDSRIIEDPFRDFDIKSDTRTLSLSFRQPISQSPSNEFALSLAFDLRRSRTFLLDEPFSFNEGPDNGESRVSVVRFAQDWVDRGTTRVLAARSQFSFGIDAFDATINNTGTDGRFFSWLGQFQWVQQLSPRILLLSRLDAQLTPDSLLSLERFGLGGVDTIRGYRQNEIVADNAILGSVEVRVPLTSDPNILQIAPFIEIGTAWNNRFPNPDPATLAGLGLGLRWLVSPNLALRLDYGIPLIPVANRGDSLQDQGFYFSLRYQPF